MNCDFLCFLQVRKGKLTDILNLKALQTLGIICEIPYILYFNLWNQSYVLKRERAEGIRVSLGWGCYYKLEELKMSNDCFVQIHFQYNLLWILSVIALNRAEAYHRCKIYAIAEGSTISCICLVVQWLQVKRFSVYRLIRLQIQVISVYM